MSQLKCPNKGTKCFDKMVRKILKAVLIINTKLDRTKIYPKIIKITLYEI